MKTMLILFTFVLACLAGCAEPASMSRTSQQLSGIGFATTPMWWDFTVMTEFTTTPSHSFTLKNSDSRTLDVTDISIDNLIGSGYTIDSTTCGGTMHHDDTCNIVIKFEPTSYGQDSGSLVIETDLGTWVGAEEVGINWVLGGGASRLNLELAGDGHGGVFSDGGGNPNIVCGYGVAPVAWPSIGTDCSGLFADEGDKFLTAFPIDPDTFVGWSLESCGSDLVCEVPLSITEPVTVTATFAHVDPPPDCCE